jgi:hypothetical protein
MRITASRTPKTIRLARAKLSRRISFHAILAKDGALVLTASRVLFLSNSAIFILAI